MGELIADNFMWFPGSPVEIKGETEDFVFRDLKAFEVQSFRMVMLLGEDSWRSSDTQESETTVKDDHTGKKKKGQSPLRPPKRSLPSGDADQVDTPVKFQEFTVTKFVDYASPMLYKALCKCGHKGTGRVRIPTAMLSMRKPGGGHMPYMEFTFKDVVITRIDWSGGEGDATPTEELTFQCSAMGFRYTRQKATGVEAKEREWRWDTAENRYGYGSGG